MRARILLTTVTLLATAALLVPAASAQSTPPKATIDVLVKWGMNHAEMELPLDGRTVMDLEVQVIGTDFVCAPNNPKKLKVEIEIASFPTWAGSSVVPKLVPPPDSKTFFVFDGASPGFAKKEAQNSPNDEAKLDIKWDTESAPKVNAVTSYKVRGILKTEADGACFPQVSTVNTPWSTEMAVRLPDRTDTANLTVKPEVCEDNPYAQGCPALTATQNNTGGEAPGLDLVVVLMGLVGMVGIWRRHRN